MTTPFDDIELETVGDYKFFAYIIGQKLRNPNFKAQWLESFIKTFLQQIKTVCSLKCYQKIEKSLGEIANQKHQQEQEEKQKLKKESHRKEKNLKTAKVLGKVDKYGRDIDDIPSSSNEESDQEYD